MNAPRWRIADLMTLTFLAAILMVVARFLPGPLAQPERPGANTVAGLLAGLLGLCLGGLLHQSPFSLLVQLPLRLATGKVGGSSRQGPPTRAVLWNVGCLYLANFLVVGAVIGSIGGYLTATAERHGYTKAFAVAKIGLFLGWTIGLLLFRRIAHRGPSPAVSSAPAIDSTRGPD